MKNDIFAPLFMTVVVGFVLVWDYLTYRSVLPENLQLMLGTGVMILLLVWLRRQLDNNACICRKTNQE